MILMSVPIGDTLAVYVYDGTDPHLCIERRDGGLVRVEPAEARRLAVVLLLAAGDLAALEKMKEAV